MDVRHECSAASQQGPDECRHSNPSLHTANGARASLPARPHAYAQQQLLTAAAAAAVVEPHQQLHGAGLQRPLSHSLGLPAGAGAAAGRSTERHEDLAFTSVHGQLRTSGALAADDLTGGAPRGDDGGSTLLPLDHQRRPQPYAAAVPSQAAAEDSSSLRRGFDPPVPLVTLQHPHSPQQPVRASHVQRTQNPQQQNDGGQGQQHQQQWGQTHRPAQPAKPFSLILAPLEQPHSSARASAPSRGWGEDTAAEGVGRGRAGGRNVNAAGPPLPGQLSWLLPAQEQQDRSMAPRNLRRQQHRTPTESASPTARAAAAAAGNRLTSLLQQQEQSMPTEQYSLVDGGLLARLLQGIPPTGVDTGFGLQLASSGQEGSGSGGELRAVGDAVSAVAAAGGISGSHRRGNSGEHDDRAQLQPDRRPWSASQGAVHALPVRQQLRSGSQGQAPAAATRAAPAAAAGDLGNSTLVLSGAWQERSAHDGLRQQVPAGAGRSVVTTGLVVPGSFVSRYLPDATPGSSVDVLLTVDDGSDGGALTGVAVADHARPLGGANGSGGGQRQEYMSCYPGTLVVQRDGSGLLASAATARVVSSYAGWDTIGWRLAGRVKEGPVAIEWQVRPAAHVVLAPPPLRTHGEKQFEPLTRRIGALSGALGHPDVGEDGALDPLRLAASLADSIGIEAAAQLASALSSAQLQQQLAQALGRCRQDSEQEWRQQPPQRRRQDGELESWMSGDEAVGRQQQQQQGVFARGGGGGGSRAVGAAVGGGTGRGSREHSSNSAKEGRGGSYAKRLQQPGALEEAADVQQVGGA